MVDYNTFPLYAMYEKDNSGFKGMNRITIEDANVLNNEGYGIFWCVNQKISSEERLANDLSNIEIKYNYIDLDAKSGNKNLQWIKILESPIIPSLCIETKSGFHVYWRNVSGNDINTFKEIQKRLIEFFEADKAAKDVLRVLRCPGFNQWKHYKDTKEPFLIEKIFNNEISYTNEDFLSIFIQSEDSLRTTFETDKEAFIKTKNTNIKKWDIKWDEFTKMDQKELLLRLSGTEYVNNEIYTFSLNNNGTEQIVVNGLSTSCFIKNNQIVADTGFGNNIFNWLRWREYNNSDRSIIEILKHIVPEIFKDK